MKLVIFIQFVVLLKLLVYCGRGEDKIYQPLVITEKNGKFELTKPHEYNEYTSVSSFFAPAEGNTFIFCPSEEIAKYVEERYKNALHYVKRIQSMELIDDSEKCDDYTQVEFIKVMNPNKLKSHWSNEIELYHSGFLLYIGDLTTEGRNVGVKPEYEAWDSNYDLVVGISIYFNTVMRQTVAVEYDLLSTSIISRQINYSAESFKEISSLKIPFVQFVQGNKDFDVIKNKVPSEWKQFLTSYRQKNGKLVSLLPFASSQHFPLPIWKLSIKVIPNLSPLWYESEKSWKDVQIFAQLIAKHLGDLKVTAGVTGTISVPNQNNQPISLSIQYDGNEVRLPKYLWMAFEYASQGEIYGIFVVLQSNPFLFIESSVCEEDVCGNNAWPISTINDESGEIYCCDMTDRNITALEAKFLSLKKRKVFDLNNWSEKQSLIYQEFEELRSENN